jgi:hypothetical protein
MPRVVVVAYTVDTPSASGTPTAIAFGSRLRFPGCGKPVVHVPA